MSPAKRISIGAVLMPEAQAADDCFVPTEPMPGPWKDAFESEHANGPAWQGLFTSCRIGRDWALRLAPQVVLTIDCRLVKPAFYWEQRKHGVVTILNTRMAQPGASPPKVAIVCADTATSRNTALDMLAAIAEVAPGVTVLAVELPGDVPGTGHTTEFLAQAAGTFAQLASLTVRNCPPELPPRSRHPHLRHISVSIPDQNSNRVLSTLRPYLNQLTSLDLQFKDTPRGDWVTLLIRANDPSHTLTTLSTNAPLCQGLIGFLVQQAPAVTDLSVGALSRHDQELWEQQGVQTWADKVWGVERLTVAQCETVRAEYLARLPATSDGGILTLCVTDCVVQFYVAADLQDFSMAVQQRLAHWQLQAGRYDIVMDSLMSLESQITALPRVLNHLSTLPHPPPVYLRQPDWHWPPELLRVLIDAPASTPNINATVHIGELTDELLSLVLQAHRHVASVHVGSLRLQSDAHANTLWPWDELTCHTVDITQMIKFPHVKTVRANYIVMPTDITQAVDTYRALFTRTQWVGVCDTSYVNLCVGGPLTDELLGLLVDVRGRKIRLSFDGLGLQSDTHANTAWSIDELLCGVVDVTQVGNLPVTKTLRAGVVVIPENATEDTDRYRALFNRTVWAGMCDASYVKLCVGGPLTDELLGLLIHVRGSKISLPVASLNLQSDTHANTPWSIEELTCDTVDVTQVVKLPKVTQVRTREIVIPENATEMLPALQRLATIKWLPGTSKPDDTPAPVKLSLHCTEGDQTKQAALLSLAYQINVQGTTDIALRPVGWRMTRATIGAWRPDVFGLSVLPMHMSTLDLSQCREWPLTTQEYVTLLPRCIPANFTVWKLPCSDWPLRDALDFCGMRGVSVEIDGAI